MVIDLSGKIAMVSGGTRGIGKAVAEKYIDAGAKVIVLGRNIQVCQETWSKRYLDNVCFFCCDVSDYEQIEYTFSQISDEYSHIDILANIAGISPKSQDGMKIKAFEQDVFQWNHVMDVNLNSMFYLSKKVIPKMIERKYGRIINMSSIVGLTNSEHGPASAAYVVSKTGVIGLTRALAYDLAPYNITVNAVAPGRIVTDMSTANNSLYNELHKKLIPMHRFGNVDDVANIFLFLASDECNYMTGETINITGGWLI